MWKTDRLSGKIVGSETGGKPSPNHNFSDAMDAVRYAMESLRPDEDEEEEYTTGQITKLWA